MMAYMNGWDRSREAERRAADEAREKAAREADARLAELDRKVARIEGVRDTLRDQALANAELREAERIRLAAARGEVTARYVDGEPLLELKAGSTVTEEEVDAAIRVSLGIADAV